MPTPRATKAQLKKLKSAGLYSGKLPRGERLTRAQKALVTKYKDVATGKARVIKPKNAKDYKRIFKTVGDKVIVPKHRGETYKVNKKGNIERTRKGPRGRKIKSVFRRHPPGKPVPPPEAVAPTPSGYSIPFARKIGKGRYKLEWVRFPTRDALNKFMAEYEAQGRYQDWANFVMEDFYEPDEFTREEISERLTDAAVASGVAQRGDFEPGPLDSRMGRRSGA